MGRTFFSSWAKERPIARAPPGSPAMVGQRADGLSDNVRNTCQSYPWLKQVLDGAMSFTVQREVTIVNYRIGSFKLFMQLVVLGYILHGMFVTRSFNEIITPCWRCSRKR